ncbi:MAG: phosphoadenylyl-sulfate reductase [Bacteroidetes bacterium]|jgi:phosphoadenosine phosphosulfate reductase|nr:phosphoadenylyl-sulfate reductase [Bacteroidota bacterium]MBT6685673.1 phosphoadenylyl-sulfate reductase [Bacteroidota bacterium]MBT7141897.1 phosphoadenylyl-sulfate reductase [Bacteroidota bacterium]MBT7491026.1 phosphoadenylyl-sulfate reductase [Bacteroidota bacterium]
MDLKSLNNYFKNEKPESLLEWCISELYPNVAMTTSFQISGLVIIHMIKKIMPDFPIVFIDTSYHFPETIEYKNKLVEEWDLNLVTVNSNSVNGKNEINHDKELYKTDTELCCKLNKIDPQKKYMKESGIINWISGLRKDQGETRASHDMFMKDKCGYVRIHPLVYWTWNDVWEYIRINKIPYNILYDFGYTSIGCSHCTSPNTIGSGERNGRWKNSTKKECGLHIELLENNSKIS